MHSRSWSTSWTTARGRARVKNPETRAVGGHDERWPAGAMVSLAAALATGLWVVIFAVVRLAL